MHPCPKNENYANCQWVFEPSTKRKGVYYIKSAQQDLYIHANGGAHEGNALIVHPCPRDQYDANCQWLLEEPPTPSSTPFLTPSPTQYIKSVERDNYIHADG